MPTTPSETSIANGALVLLGAKRINSLDDPNKKAKIMKERFSEDRDEILREHDWNFASTRVQLAADTVAPVFGHDNAFTLPQDYIAVREVVDNDDIGYRVESGKVLTDIDAPLSVRYTRRETNMSLADPLFRKALSARLAATCCEAITGSNAKVAKAEAAEREILNTARFQDSAEDPPAEVISSEWEDARGSSHPLRSPPSGPGTPL